MHLAPGITVCRLARFGSAMTLSESTDHSEGAASMTRQHTTDAYSRDVVIRRGGGGGSPLK